MKSRIAMFRLECWLKIFQWTERFLTAFCWDKDRQVYREGALEVYEWVRNKYSFAYWRSPLNW
jgi:hypothetical protein